MLFNFLRYLLLLFIVSGIIYSLSGCTDEPGSVGLNFIPPSETTGVRIFDSSKDTMNITSTPIRKYVNNSASNNIIIGIKNDFISKALIKFSLSPDYDSAVVNSAVLTLTYRNYYYPNSFTDSLGQLSFDIYRVLQNINYWSITYDSLTSSVIGNVSQGSYTGVPAQDSQKITVNLNQQLIKDWLEYTADTNYPEKNYGIGLIPNNSSSVLKGFYSNQEGSSVAPALRIIVTKNNQTDTLDYTATSNVFLATANIPIQIGTFTLQAGVAINQILKFDMSKIPSTATINDAQIYFTLDASNSIFTSQTSYQIALNYVTDTSGSFENNVYTASQVSGNSNQYSVRIILPFQRWLQGDNNYGVILRPYNQYTNLDRFVFYDVNASDPSKRPRVVIKYTPRITP